jgi:hypothetical protein
MTEQEKIIEIFNNGFQSNILNFQDKEVDLQVLPVTNIMLVFRSIVDLMISAPYQGIIQMLGPYLVVLTDSTGGEDKILDFEIFKQKFIENGRHEIDNILEIGINGFENKISLLSHTTIIENQMDVIPLSKVFKNYKFFLVEGNTITTIQNGIPLHMVPNVLSTDKIRAFSFKIPANDCKALLSRYVTFFDTEVIQDDFWESKTRGELIPSPESNFSNNLFLFFKNTITGGHVDREAFSKHTENRTDVRIITSPDQNIHVYEVKWIGKTKSSSSYNGAGAHTRASSGIVQLEEYLTERKCKQGALVVFDGRLEDEEIKWIKNQSSWDLRIDKPPTIVKLKTESASKKAERITDEEKKK